MADYSKWDQLAREEEAAERREREAKRADNRARYFKEQEEKKLKYHQEQEAKKKAAQEAGHEHHHAHADGHGHSHGGDGHGHSHGGSEGPPAADMQPMLQVPRRPACGCGYADIEEMKRAAAAAAQEPQLTAEEKNQKKLIAVRATREHGKELFGEGKYNEAFAVYERGVLIASGALGASAAVQAELSQLEVLLDLNMSLCKLKLREWKEAQDQARMALQLDPTSVKAHFRLAQGAVGMANWDEAREHLARATELDSKQGDACKKEIAVLLADIRRKEAEEKEKVRAYQKQLEATLQAKREAFAAPATAATPSSTSDAAAASTTSTGFAQSVSSSSAQPGAEVDELAQTLRDAALHPASAADAGWAVDGPQHQPPAAQ